MKCINMIVCSTCQPDYPELHNLSEDCSHEFESFSRFYVSIANRPWFNEPDCFYTYSLVRYHFNRTQGYTP